MSHFESIISGHPSDELQSALFESYSHRLLETRGDDPLYATSEEYPLSGVATAVENALFSTVTRTCDSSTCAAGATHFLSTNSLWRDTR